MSTRHRLLLLIALSIPVTAGQFKRSLGRGESLQVKLPGLPAVRIGRATLAIDVKDATGAAIQQPNHSGAGDPQNPGAGWGTAPTAITAVPANELQAALDRVFRESFTIVQSNGDAILRVAVTHYAPAESAIQAVQQKARVPAVNPDGSQATDPQTGQPMTVEQQVPVEQWIARGQIALRVEVVDSSGALNDGFAPQASVRAAQVISVDGQDRVDRTQLPTTEQVLAKLLGDLVAQFAPRYCPPAQETEIPLAVDEELRAGNQLARNGAFADAAKSWQETTVKKNEGDRIHNLGTVYEAQAYAMLISSRRSKR